MMDNILYRYLRFVARHQLAYPVVAAVAAVVIVVLNPGDVWAWILVALAAAWLAVTVRR